MSDQKLRFRVYWRTQLQAAFATERAAVGEARMRWRLSPAVYAVDELGRETLIYPVREKNKWERPKNDEPTTDSVR